MTSTESVVRAIRRQELREQIREAEREAAGLESVERDTDFLPFVDPRETAVSARDQWLN